ncbi:MAG: hypothetical protein WD876_00435 [Candidatus Pacearchaeota archaeon]
MIPEIEFVYSSVYDNKWNAPQEKLPIKLINNYLKLIEKMWGRIAKKTLGEISKNSGLKWRERKIKCYFLSKGKSFSDPLTIKYYKDKKYFIDVLTHELIHQIQTQDTENRWYKWRNYIAKKYSKETKLTRGHIFLNAVLYKVVEKVHGKKRLNSLIKFDWQFKDYKRSWEIVQNEGYQNIINEFRKRIGVN